MAKFKVIISNPETKKSNFVEIEGPRAVPLIGRKISEIIDGTVVGLSGQKLQITGGSDKDGVPMRHNIHGGVRAAVVLSRGVGFKPPPQTGERKRKNIRGNTITEDIVQINKKIVKAPEKEERKEKPKKAEKKEKETEKAPKKTAKETTEKTGGKSTEETAQTA